MSFVDRLQLNGLPVDASDLLFNGSTMLDRYASGFASLNSVLDSVTRSSVISNLSKNKGLSAINSDKITMAQKFTLNGYDGLREVLNATRIPGTTTEQIINKTRVPLNNLGLIGGSLGGLYVASNAFEEYEVTLANGHDPISGEVAKNVATRILGTAGELGISHLTAHAAGLLGGALAAPVGVGIGSPATYVLGYGAAYAGATIYLSLSGTGTNLNNIITNGYRNIIESFEPKEPVNRGQMGRVQNQE